MNYRQAIIEAARELAVQALEERAQAEGVEVTAVSLDREAARILRGVAGDLEAGGEP